MREEQQIEMVARLQETDPYRRWNYAARSMRNPASHYVDPAWFEDEKAALFRGGPQFVGLAVECAAPGDYLTLDCGSIPILIVRQRDGGLKAFVNACRHRATPLLDGEGKHGRRPIVCPYHAWTYDLDGHLLARPHSDGAFDDLGDPCDLASRAVSEAHGLIYVHPTSAAPFAIADLLHGMDGEFAGYGIETAYRIDRRETVLPINWKLVLDTFLEAYHVRSVHRNSIDKTFLSHQLFDGFGPSARVVGLRRSAIEQLEEGRLFPNAAVVYVLLPNALLTYQGDHIETWRFEPIEAFTTRAITTIFAPAKPETDKALLHWQRNFETLCKVAFEEDFPIQQRIQNVLRSGAVDHVYYGRLEPALIHCHTSINGIVEAWRANRS
jgi:phenylpropionate dioxygenase-like ring-hydroxylating dioxygenase large terminal subunit